MSKELGTPNCPKCGQPLQVIRYPAYSPLNRDQWDSIRAGDYFCTCHNNHRGKEANAYFWAHELRRPLPPDQGPASEREADEERFDATLPRMSDREIARKLGRTEAQPSPTLEPEKCDHVRTPMQAAMESAPDPLEKLTGQFEPQWLAAAMDYLISVKAPDSVSGYDLCNAIRPSILSALREVKNMPSDKERELAAYVEAIERGLPGPKGNAVFKVRELSAQLEAARNILIDDGHSGKANCVACRALAALSAGPAKEGQ